MLYPKRKNLHSGEVQYIHICVLIFSSLLDVEPVKVQVTFVTTFTDHLYVSMDVELLLFLHDLVIAYMEYKQKGTKNKLYHNNSF